jgi:hypothetical protein
VHLKTYTTAHAKYIHIAIAARETYNIRLEVLQTVAEQVDRRYTVLVI